MLNRPRIHEMRLLIGNSFRTIIWAIAIIVISTLAAMVVMWRAPALKLAARDALVRARGTAAPPDEVVIVAIDEASVKRLGRFPWPRHLMAQALNKISDARPKVIAIHALYSDPTNEADDAALAEAIKRAGNVVAAAQLIETQLGGAEWLRPLPAIEKAAAAVGHGNVLTDVDGVARSLTLRQTDDEGNAFWAMAVEAIRGGDGRPRGFAVRGGRRPARRADAGRRSFGQRDHDRLALALSPGDARLGCGDVRGARRRRRGRRADHGAGQARIY